MSDQEVRLLFVKRLGLKVGVGASFDSAVVLLRFKDEASALQAVRHNERVGGYSRLSDHRALLPMINRGDKWEEVSLP